MQCKTLLTLRVRFYLHYGCFIDNPPRGLVSISYNRDRPAFILHPKRSSVARSSQRKRITVSTEPRSSYQRRINAQILHRILEL